MKLSQLIKVTAKGKKRVGRGIGSGKGRTAGRGSKGQKARGKIPLGFAGGTLPLYKRLPFKRGLGNPKVSAKLMPIDTAKLSVFKSGSVVNLQSLIEQGIVKEKDGQKYGVKIVGNKKMKVALNVKLSATAAATKVIEQAGGKVENA